MDLLFWGLTFGVVGKVLLGITVMMVHWKIVKEHGIDRQVLKVIHRERILALLGIVFITTGYILEVVFYEYTSISICGFVSTETCIKLLGQ